MEFVDVHCHLDDPRYADDLDNVIERAKEAGAVAIISSGVNPESNRRVLELSKKYNIVRASFGLYPLDSIADKAEVGDDVIREIKPFSVDEELKWIEEHESGCVSIGEVGLDYKLAPGTEEFQKEVFKKAIALAMKLDKPIVIHSRKAELDCIEILEKMNCKKVVMHCFSGKKSLIKRCVENGWFLSVPSIITRLQHFQTMAEIVPLENLLTETDGPYLAPVAGELSESADIVGTIKEIARIKDVSEEEVGRVIFNNARELFRL